MTSTRAVSSEKARGDTYLHFFESPPHILHPCMTRLAVLNPGSVRPSTPYPNNVTAFCLLTKDQLASRTRLRDTPAQEHVRRLQGRQGSHYTFQGHPMVTTCPIMKHMNIRDMHHCHAGIPTAHTNHPTTPHPLDTAPPTPTHRAGPSPLPSAPCLTHEQRTTHERRTHDARGAGCSGAQEPAALCRGAP